MGIETLSRNHRHYNAGHSKRKARVAALCALLPGMGAVYNRQNVKAIVHFVAIMGLFQLTEIRILEGFFALGGLAAYFYSIIDAYRTAQSILLGESAAVDEERFKRRLVKRAFPIGVILITAGLLLFIQLMRPFNISISLAGLLPVALIILGGYLLTRHFKVSRDEEIIPDYSARPPFNLIAGNFTEHGYQGRGKTSRPGDRR